VDRYRAATRDLIVRFPADRLAGDAVMNVSSGSEVADSRPDIHDRFAPCLARKQIGSSRPTKPPAEGPISDQFHQKRNGGNPPTAVILRAEG
jgi:hypothetical protein